MSITYTATLSVRDETVLRVSALLYAERLRRGTRANRRVLSCHQQAVLVLRWLLDGTRMSQLVRDNAISTSTGYDRLHEGIAVLAAQAPGLYGALLAAKAAGYDYVLLDGTLIETNRVSTPGPTAGVDLWWSAKHKNHGGNIQVLTAPDGWPLWTSPVRPGREHDTTCLRTHPDLLDTLTEVRDDLRTLTDLGYEGEADTHRPTTHLQPSPQPPTRGRRTRQQPAQDNIQSPAQHQPGPLAHRRHRRRGPRRPPNRPRKKYLKTGATQSRRSLPGMAH